MQVSSTTAYGFHRDNPPLLHEESPLRGNNDFTYAKNKKDPGYSFKYNTREAFIDFVRYARRKQFIYLY